MEFIFPNFLWALFALLIPIIIHLFHFKRFKKVYFTNVDLLTEAKQSAATKSRLKHILTLLSRLLFIFFLVLAFTQPFIPPEGKSAHRNQTEAISIFIDNSFSMQREGEEAILFESARTIAEEIIKAQEEQILINIITNDLDQTHYRFVNKEQALEFVDGIQISSATAQFNSIINQQKKLALQNNLRGMQSWMISDFQSNGLKPTDDTLLDYRLIPLRSNQKENVFIDSVYLSSPIQLVGESVDLIISITNNSERNIEQASKQALQIELNGIVKPGNYSAKAGRRGLDTLKINLDSKGWNTGSVRLEDYPITFDDTYYFAFEVFDKVKVLHIYEGLKKPFIPAVYANPTSFDFNSIPISSLDFSLLKNQQCILLDGLKNISSGLAAELTVYLDQGGKLCVFPSENMDPISYNDFFTSIGVDRIGNLVKREVQVTYINTADAVYKDVFQSIPNNVELPRVQAYYNVLKDIDNGGVDILGINKQIGFFTKYNSLRGQLYFSSAPLSKDFTNFANHALFVPLLYRISILGASSESISRSLSPSLQVKVNDFSNANESPIVLSNQESEWIPKQRRIGNQAILFLGSKEVNQSSDVPMQAGIYDLTKADEIIGKTAFNYERKESDLKFAETGELPDYFPKGRTEILEDIRLDQVSQKIQSLSKGKSLWKLCIILALVFLAIEVVLLRVLRSDSL